MQNKIFKSHQLLGKLKRNLNFVNVDVLFQFSLKNIYNNEEEESSGNQDENSDDADNKEIVLIQHGLIERFINTVIVRITICISFCIFMKTLD